MDKSIGILLRGASLINLPTIIDKFDTCFIVSWIEELNIFGNHIIGKNIIQYTNSSELDIHPKEVYKKFSIDKVIFPFTKSMLTKNKKLPSFYRKKGIKEVEFLPEKYKKMTLKIRNTGVTCIFYVSEFLKPEEIWIIGLDFYKEDYMVKKNKPRDIIKSKKNKMIKRFIDIVKSFPEIQYNVVTLYKKLPKLKNLKVIN